MPKPWERAEPLFRFVQVRAPAVTRPVSGQRLPRIRTYFAPEPTRLHRALQAAFAAGSSDDMIAAAQRFINAKDRTEWNGAIFRGNRSDIDDWLWNLDDVLIAGGSALAVGDLEKTLLTALTFFGHDGVIDWRAATDAVQKLWHDCGDSMIAVSVSPSASAESQALLARVMRLICLLKEITDAGWTPGVHAGDAPPKALSTLISAARVQLNLVDALVLLPTDIFPLPRAEPGGRIVASRPPDRLRDPAAKSISRLQLVQASRDLSRALQMGEESFRPNNKTDYLPKVSDLASRISAPTGDALKAAAISNETSVPDAFRQLDRLIEAAPGLPLQAPEPVAIAALRIMNVSGRLGGVGGQPDTSFTVPGLTAGDWDAAALTRAPVVGDLLVVQQDLLRYEEGEVADIENILAKEHKRHIHQFKDLTEQETTVTTEHEEDRTHDSQTTDRQELSQEASKQSSAKMSLEAGVTVSGQFGPVNVSANTQFSYQTSTTESNRSASTFSKEVIDKSVQTVKDRRVEQQRMLTRQKVLDRNEHEFNNDSDANVVGIYQWVDKIYEAATFNYGLRMMLDVMVPEPALYLEYARALQAATTVSADPPPPLTIQDPTSGNTRELKADDIGDAITISDLASTYRVRGLTQPPPRWVTVSVKLGEDTSPSA
jgi:hypothetical protein